MDVEPPFLEGIDHIEFYVGNAYQAAHYYRTVYGFNIVACCGLTTGRNDQAGYVLEQGDIRFVLTSALSPDSPIARHCALHGDSVKSIAFRVSDVEAAIEAVKDRGATTVVAPLSTWKDEFGELSFASIKVFGDTVHTFIDRSKYNGTFAPHYAPYEGVATTEVGLSSIDHVVGNVDLGAMDFWARYYERIFDFKQTTCVSDEVISTEETALICKVMRNESGNIKFPINEPAAGKRRGQVEEFLDFHKGPGVQHIAMLTDDIITTVAQLKQRGVEFLDVPETYYEMLADRVGKIDEDVNILREHCILVDRDETGYLLQVYTKPITDRPTLFMEIIQRKGSQGFGLGNCRAMFASFEREQRRRGTL